MSSPLCSLPVVLKHRSDDDLKQWLDDLRLRAKFAAAKGGIQKLYIFADLEWMQQQGGDNDNILGGQQCQAIFETLGQVAMETVEELTIDFMFGLYNQENPAAAAQQIQVLPCSLLTSLLKHAPKLQNMALRELQLQGTDREAQELASCLPPRLQAFQLQWKGSSHDNPLGVLDPLIAAMSRLANLQEIDLMIPSVCPSLELLANCSTLQSVQISVPQTPDNNRQKAGRIMTRLLQSWKKMADPWNNKQALQELKLSAWTILQNTHTQAALMGFVRQHPTLERLAVVDDNSNVDPNMPALAFTTSESSSSSGSDSEEDITSANKYNKNNHRSFVDMLVEALQSNRVLKQLQLVSQGNNNDSYMYYPPTATTKANKNDRLRARKLLGSMMEHNFALEQIEVAHDGIRISAPSYSRQTWKAKHFRPTHALDFYLQLNQDGYRRQLLSLEQQMEHEHDVNKDKQVWMEAVLNYQDDTPALYALLQSCPSAITGVDC